ncbi:hypothetical protein L7D45_14530 [Brucella pseudogrignonensis]|uniref:hypothetical protein n=1 Tax=Brucella pseudogrignonensis TaxID=419475 RepID=UPI001EDA0B85|nr:hypothetical protein [Brucella pseudogrignonensis]UKK94966.1 hypothetical protein L7D45_14530 [Brucella pseudogrignonensis]
MKLIAWALGTLFAVWLAAFVGIKIYDLNCVANPSVCFTETGIWLRKFVLLEWASKWQTLLGGLAAVLAGTFVLFATRMQLSEARRNAIIELNQQLSHEMYLSFQALQAVGRSWQLTLEQRQIYIDQAIASMRAVTRCCPQLATEIIAILTRLRNMGTTYSNDAAILQAYSMVVATVANELTNEKKSVIPYQAEDIKMSPSVIVQISDQSDILLSEFDDVLQYC